MKLHHKHKHNEFRWFWSINCKTQSLYHKKYLLSFSKKWMKNSRVFFSYVHLSVIYTSALPPIKSLKLNLCLSLPRVQTLHTRALRPTFINTGYFFVPLKILTLITTTRLIDFDKCLNLISSTQSIVLSRV